MRGHEGNHDILIIGAGPAGLALAYCLGHYGLDYLVLDKAENVGSSFRAMYDSIFFGPWMNNTLPGSPSRMRDWFRRTSKQAWLEYLERYVREHDLKLQLNTPVTKVECRGRLLYVHTPTEVLTAPMVVNATGYFGQPWAPRFAGQDTTKIPQMHARDYRSPASVAERTPGYRVLIVGKRVTAGELMVELHKAGYEVSLSCKSELRFGSSYFEQALYGPCVLAIEQIGAWIGMRLPDTNPRMVGGETTKLVRRGLVSVHPNISSIEERAVRFVDGVEQPFDLIIYATGYRPCLPHLEGLVRLDPSTGCPSLAEFESTEVPCLYFLGVDNLCSFRSRYLRGIREDAWYLARELSDRLDEIEQPELMMV